jgi:hypothetical protein
MGSPKKADGGRSTVANAAGRTDEAWTKEERVAARSQSGWFSDRNGTRRARAALAFQHARRSACFQTRPSQCHIAHGALCRYRPLGKPIDIVAPPTKNSSRMFSVQVSPPLQSPTPPMPPPPPRLCAPASGRPLAYRMHACEQPSATCVQKGKVNYVPDWAVKEHKTLEKDKEHSTQPEGHAHDAPPDEIAFESRVRVPRKTKGYQVWRAPAQQRSQSLASDLGAQGMLLLKEHIRESDMRRLCVRAGGHFAQFVDPKFVAQSQAAMVSPAAMVLRHPAHTLPPAVLASATDLHGRATGTVLVHERPPRVTRSLGRWRCNSPPSPPYPIPWPTSLVPYSPRQPTSPFHSRCTAWRKPTRVQCSASHRRSNSTRSDRSSSPQPRRPRRRHRHRPR